MVIKAPTKPLQPWPLQPGFFKRWAGHSSIAAFGISVVWMLFVSGEQPSIEGVLTLFGLCMFCGLVVRSNAKEKYQKVIAEWDKEVKAYAVIEMARRSPPDPRPDIKVCVDALSALKLLGDPPELPFSTEQYQSTSSRWKAEERAKQLASTEAEITNYFLHGLNQYNNFRVGVATLRNKAQLLLLASEHVLTGDEIPPKYILPPKLALARFQYPDKLKAEKITVAFQGIFRGFGINMTKARDARDVVIIAVITGAALIYYSSLLKRELAAIEGKLGLYQSEAKGVVATLRLDAQGNAAVWLGLLTETLLKIYELNNEIRQSGNLLLRAPLSFEVGKLKVLLAASIGK